MARPETALRATREIATCCKDLVTYVLGHENYDDTKPVGTTHGSQMEGATDTRLDLDRYR